MKLSLVYCTNIGQPSWLSEVLEAENSKTTVILTSCDVIRLCCGPQGKHFRTYFVTPKFRCHSCRYEEEVEEEEEEEDDDDEDRFPNFLFLPSSKPRCDLFSKLITCYVLA